MAKDECSFGDRISIGPDIGLGSIRPCIRHTPDHQIKHGWVKDMHDGEPIAPGASVVTMSYDDQHGDYRVDSEVSLKDRHPPCQSKSGPAMVSSDEYRTGWDRIFGNKAPVGSA